MLRGHNKDALEVSAMVHPGIPAKSGPCHHDRRQRRRATCSLASPLHREYPSFPTKAWMPVSEAVSLWFIPRSRDLGIDAPRQTGHSNMHYATFLHGSPRLVIRRRRCLQRQPCEAHDGQTAAAPLGRRIGGILPFCLLG